MTTTTTTPLPEMEPSTRKVLAAVLLFISRQARQSHPDGRFDRAGRWYADDREHQTCCDGIRSPSRNFPFTNNIHCRSAGHVRALTGVEIKPFNALLKPLRQQFGSDDSILDAFDIRRGQRWNH